MIERTYTSEITEAMDGETVSVAGHVHELRDLGGLVFVIVRDRDGLIQGVFKEDREPELFEQAEELGAEDVVRVTGEVTESGQAPGGVELVPEELEVIDEADAPLPLEISKDVDADLSTRLDHRGVDLRQPEVMAVFTLKSKLMDAMEEWFQNEGYVDVETPLISKGGAEGGAELFPVVYYEQEAFLSQSPQLYKQILMASGFDKIYEVGTAFRAEDFATSRHVSEISMFDVELSYIEDHHDVMDVQEESLRYALRAVADEAERELDELGVDLTVPEEDFPRITFDEALDILEAQFGHFPEDPTDLDTKGERLLGQHFEEQGHPAFFVVGYPGEKFYYMQDVEGDDIASRKFDLIYKGQELSSGGQRQHDVDVMKEVMAENDVPEENFEFYLEGLSYGTPPHGGYGLGIDRLVQKVCDLDNIKEAILFPRDPTRLTP
ncbi:aspartate--tRNA(Asn) ligase [Halocalculus aciditolerans]|uniref:Aspartate--tRNA(Asp/Asn) ligase n=1 Tax=Halocalculus aciditolerans TaxID=1383812 RepID=A0A830FH91_9EURY|nr:aspartate--tRNA(Asn) ligase [Halocalculus aciditolerans]GGL52525.1 aspartate--tRNA(Asp/Asn) ligase [Halocalculus aciditolerans]